MIYSCLNLLCLRVKGVWASFSKNVRQFSVDKRHHMRTYYTTLLQKPLNRWCIDTDMMATCLSQSKF